jgi:hypothetical protein
VTDGWVLTDVFDSLRDFQDLNPLDFFIFIRNIQDNVYLTPPDTREELRKRIVQVRQEIPSNFLLNAMMSVSRRCRQCFQTHRMEAFLSNLNRFYIVPR